MQSDLLTNTASAPAPKARSAADRMVSARRWFALWLVGPVLLLSVQGCSNLSRSSFDAMKLAAHGYPHAQPTAAEVAAKPYFQLQATTPDGSAVLILGNIDGQRQAWYGAHQAVIFIEHGRVVKTTGLSQNLDGLSVLANDPFVHGLQKLGAPVSYNLREDWSPDYRYGVHVDATLTSAGREQISILGRTHDVVRVDEQLSVPAMHYRTINHYWVDAQDGFIWKSEQQVAPGLTLQLVQLRPYREQQP
ncbi:YjbF family lipoprotein [Rhodanobacter sp. Col0626]|uniref:YjbF family lipoprotein n=1 Tax=Rhodanobacter sp. Col0626 TaxID=3415679 RepID=UPI003CF43BA8